MQSPSLLDWLKYKFGRPRHLRLFRFALAGLAGLWGLMALLGAGRLNAAGLLWLVAAAGLFAWGLAVRDTDEPAPEMPGLDLTPAGAGAVAAGAAQVDRRAAAARLLAGLRLPSVLVLALAAQATLTYASARWRLGVALYALAVLGLWVAVWRDGLLGTPRAFAAPADEAVVGRLRWGWLAAAVIAGLYAFVAAGGNEFTSDGVLAWIVAVVAWLAAVWEAPGEPEQWVRAARDRLVALARAPVFSLSLSRWSALVLLVLAVGAYFRFARLDAIPLEMTSDHVEKLLDVHDLLNGRRAIFFERNTGREPLQFYLAAFLINYFGTGLTHFTLKLTGAIAGFLMLPYVYALGREVGDRRLGLLALALAAVSYWHTAISRVGLRFPLTPLFVAPVLYYVLRGARRASRNDFVLAGLFLGAGLYGYSTIRVLPLVVLALAAWLALWPQPASRRVGLLAHTVLLAATAFVVFLPLYRYATEPNSFFWLRMLSRMGDTEAAVPGPPLVIFLQNTWRALLAFNWRGDTVWVNIIPELPFLDVVTGALFVLGLAFAAARLVARRDRVAGALLLAGFLLLLPSTLSVAFPEENPSAVRMGGLIPVVMVLAAYPLWLLVERLRAVWPGRTGWQASAVAAAGVLGLAALLNRGLYFERYAAQYVGPAQNASEIAVAVRGFADSVGTLDRAYICLHPHWADTRAVGLYAGAPGWEQVLPADQFQALAADPRPLLVVVNPRSDECITALQAAFPTGTFSVYDSARGSDKDFLLFFVPARGVEG